MVDGNQDGAINACNHAQNETPIRQEYEKFASTPLEYHTGEHNTDEE